MDKKLRDEIMSIMDMRIVKDGVEYLMSEKNVYIECPVRFLDEEDARENGVKFIKTVEGDDTWYTYPKD